MKATILLILGACLTSTNGFKMPFQSTRAVIVKDMTISSPVPLRLNPADLLESTRLQPSFYAKAMREIKKLEEKPICHRMAAQLLVKNCQGMKDLDEREYKVASEGMQRHHVEVFAASLAMCDMERARMNIPNACRPFRRPALQDAVQGTGILKVSSKEVGQCMEGLSHNPSQWNTWLSYRDTSLLLCRGASVDTRKDQAMAFYKSFVEMMEQFTSALYDDLHIMRRQMKETVYDTELRLREATSQAEKLRVAVQEGFDSVADKIQDTNSVVESMRSGTETADRMMRNLIKMMVQGNAEMAAELESAIATSTSQVTTSLNDVNNLVKSNAQNSLLIQKSLSLVAIAIDALMEKQDHIEQGTLQSAKQTLMTLINATEHVQYHEERLEQASVKAEHISTKLAEADEFVTMIASSLKFVGNFLDRSIVAGFWAAAMVVRKFMFENTLRNNIILSIVGLATGAVVNDSRHGDIDSALQRCLSWTNQVYSTFDVPDAISDKATKVHNFLRNLRT